MAVPGSECIGELGGWEGYEVAAVRRVAEGLPRPQVWIELVPQQGRKLVCDSCGSEADAVHDTELRHVRDLPLFDAETHLTVHRRRVACLGCGPRLERLSWLDRYARVTRRLAESVVRLCEVLPIKHVAAFFGLGWDAVKQLDKSALERRLGTPDLDGIEVIGMDEFAIHKGHRYATVIVEPTTRRVLWVAHGRERDSIRPFFDLLGPERCARIRAAVMDMWGPYTDEVRSRCPKAEIVYDLFHVVAKYGREVIDRVRVDEANRLRHDKRARKLVKGSRWLLLRNRSSVSSENRVRLKELFDANRALLRVSLMRDDLRHLWDFKSPGHALRFWREWYQRALRSRLEPLKLFARRLAPYLDGILSHCRFPLHTGVIEGINNRIKVIKRMAYGFRDDAYFFLKIRAAFPGKAG